VARSIPFRRAAARPPTKRSCSLFDDEDQAEVEDLPPIRWSWTTPVILSGIVAAQIVEAIGDGITNLTTAVASHSNWRRQQRDFADQARRSIEEITSA